MDKKNRTLGIGEHFCIPWYRKDDIHLGEHDSDCTKVTSHRVNHLNSDFERVGVVYYF